MIDKELLAQAEQLYSSGLSLTQSAAAIGIKAGRLYYWFGADNFKLRSGKEAYEVVSRYMKKYMAQRWQNPNDRLNSQEYRQILSDQLSQRSKEWWADPKMRTQKIRAIEKAMRRPHIRKLQSDLMKGKNNDPEFRRLLHQKPNKPEQLLINLFTEHSLPFRYVGDGEFILGGKCPDFLNTNGAKQVVELFGRYWHPESDVTTRTKHFAQYGFSTLIIWENELKDIERLLTNVKAFLEEEE